MARLPRRRFRIAFLVFSAMLILPLSASALMSTGPSTDKSWAWQNPLPQGNALYGLKFTDVNTGWAVGLGGTVLKTTDAGATWGSQDPNTLKDLYGVAFADSSNGWLAGLTGTIRHTTNGGATWVTQTDGNVYNLRGVASLDANNAIVVGDKGTTYSTIAYTSNGGSNWTLGTTPSSTQLNGVAISSATRAWAVGASGTILSSTNGGVSWAAASSPSTQSLNAIACAPGTNIAYIAGSANGTSTTILKTTDGTTWQAVTPPAASLTLQAVACSADGSILTVTSSTGSVYRTADGGATWTTSKPDHLGNMAIRGVQMPDSQHVDVVGDYGAISTSANSGYAWNVGWQGTTQNLLGTYFVSSTTGWGVGASGAILKTTDGGATWASKAVTTGSLRGVMFLNATTGWIVGDAGTILKTTDGGNTWNPQTSGVATQLNGVWFADANNGWAVGTGGVVRMTTNGGTTWTTSTSGVGQALNSVWFADASNGFAVGNGGRIIRTVNGGASWIISTSGSAQALYCVRGASASTVWASGNTGTVLKTTTAGTTTWTTLTPGTTQPLYAIGFANANVGWVGGAYGTLLVTGDGGSSWAAQKAGLSTVTTDSNVPIRSIAVVDASNAFLVGDTGIVRATTDGGASWGSRQYPTIQQLNGVAFANATTGWVVGNGSLVMRTTNSGNAWAIQKPGSASNLFAVAPIDVNTAYVVGAAGTIRRTNDGGQTWLAQTSGTAVQLNAAAASGAQNAIAGGAGGAIVYTANGGSTWATATVPTAQQINALCMSTPSTGWAGTNRAAGFPNLMRTLDGGKTWAGVTTTSTANFNGIYFLPDGTTGWAVGSAGAIVKTTDGGANWTVKTSGVATVLYSVYFADANRGWAVGASGVVLRTLNGGTTWAVQQSGVGTAINLRGVSFVNGDHGWVVGTDGALLMTTDQSPPNTALTITPAAPNGTNGWYNTAPVMTLTPDEPSTSYYSWVATAGPFTQGAGPIPAPEGAATKFYYYSVDFNNNAEVVHSASLKTDYTPPTTPATVIAGTPTTSTVPFSWSAGIDGGSGIDHYDVYVGSVYATSTTATSTVLTGLSPYSNYTLTVVAVDKANLSSAPSLPLIVTTKDLDRTPLTSSVSALPSIPDGAGGWYVSAPAITLQSAPATVAATVYYSWDASSGPWTPYTSPLVAPEGQHQLWCYTHDETGVRHDEAPHQVTLNTDLIDPTAPTTVAVDTPGTSTVGVTWAGSSDADSGVSGYDVLLNGTYAAATTGTSANLSGLSPDTSYTVTVVALDNAGRISAQSDGASFSTQDVVRTPLSTVRTVAPPLSDGLSGWYKTDPAVTLTSFPTTVSAITYYSWISSAGPWSSYVSTLSPAEGVQTLWYYSHDVSGNRDDESPHTAIFATDLNPPAQVSGLVAGSPTTTTVALSWLPSTDSASGVDHYDVVVNGSVQLSTASTMTALTGLTPNTSYVISVVAVDVSGRAAAASNPVFVVTSDLDRTPLVTSATWTPSSPDGSGGWYVTAPDISLASSPSAVSATTYYSWSSVTGPWTAYSGHLSPADGTHTLHFYSHDNAGVRNDEAVKSVSYKVDTTDPTTPDPAVASAITTSSVLLSWPPSTDAASGIGHYAVRLNGSLVATPVSASTPLTGLADNTTYTVTVASVDAAGRASGWSAPVDFTTLTIDRSPLVTVANVSPALPQGLAGWYTADPSVTLVSLPTTVPALTFYSWDTSIGPWSMYLGDELNPPEGASTLWYHSSDIAAERNAEAVKHTDFKVDSLAPLPPDTVVAGLPDTSTIPVTWTGQIAGTSPIDHYNVYVNGVLRTTVTTASATLSGLAPATTYGITVTAVSQSGLESDQSIPIFAMTLDVDHTPLVTTYSISPNSPDGVSGWYVATPTITLVSAPATVSATSYYSWDTSTGPWTAYTGALAPIVGDHTLYYYSHDVSGQRNDETPKSASVKFDPVVPAQPAILTTTTVTPTSVTLVWSPVTPPPSGIARYEVWDDFIGSTSQTSYTVTGLTPRTTYPFSIIVVSGAGTRSIAETITIETSNTLLPSTPAAVYADGSKGGTVTLDWTAATDVDTNVGYNVWRSADGVTYSRVASTTGQFSTSFADGGLRSSTRYWYAVSTVDDRGESPMSVVSTPTWQYNAPITGRPQPIDGLMSTPGSATILLSWLPDANPAVTGYVVTRADKSLGAETTLTPLGIGPTPSYLDTSAVNGQTYYYRVYPVDASSTVGWGSVELEARSRSGYAGADIHVMDRQDPNPMTLSCPACHDKHFAPDSGDLLLTHGGPNEDRTCLGCHSVDTELASTDTSSEIGDPLNQSSLPIWTDATPSNTMTCISCHRAVTNDSSPTAGLLSVGGRPMSGTDGINIGDAVCYSCHGGSSTLPYGDLSGFETSVHSTEVTGPASGSQVKCEACHERHASRNKHLTSYAGYMVCAQCHTSSETSGTVGLEAGLGVNADANAGHALLPQAQANGARMSCQNCHNTHAVTHAKPLVDPRNPGPSGAWTGDGNSFCLSCHNGAPLPTAAETGPWAGAVLGSNGATTTVDIQTAYAANVHGAGIASDPTTTSAFLRPDMGYTAGKTLDCSACHDPHGSSNNYSLLTSVKSASGDKSVSGLLVYKIPAGSITPTSPVGYDTRFFCSSCHLFDPATHDPMAGTDTTQFGKTDCTSCHRHVQMDGSPSTRL